MFTTTNLINATLVLFCVAVIITVISVKSSIANKHHQVKALTTQLDEAFDQRDALQAEWARLQNRSNILALGKARFGQGVAEVAEEIHVIDLPDREANDSGHFAALTLFAHAIADQNQPGTAPENGSVPAPERSSSDPIAQIIQQELKQKDEL